ncbi:MAG: Uracil DNA glycosylase [uncultured bacterium]|nr:MAG: Uracil DNA glycosylase [uncultured bacterium]
MTVRQLFHLDAVDPSWHTCIQDALKKMDPDYLDKLYQTHHWLPGPKNILNAFSLPLDKTNYIFFGESPYPRAQSANGYAFWDALVRGLWSETGLSKTVNRATSLRNIIKMLLIAEGLLNPAHITQADITKINKDHLIKTNHELFTALLEHGFLLLNATLVLRPTKVRKDAIAWQPFMHHVLNFILKNRPNVQLILLGNVANAIDKLIVPHKIKALYAEHPYNISFIHNAAVIDFFKPLHLLRK